MVMSGFHNVYLTYRNDYGCDGVGAQLHRIYGIYCLSHLLGTRYLHTPLHDVHYQGLDAVQNQEKDPSFVAPFNRRFVLPSDRTETAVPTCMVFGHLPIGRFERALGIRYGGRRKQLSPIRLSKFGRLVAQWSKANTETVVRIAAPHTLMDRYAHGYEICKSLSPFKRSISNDVLRIALHVRRGDNVFFNSERLIDNRYYVSVTQKLVSALAREQIPFELELHSEVLQKGVTVRPDDPAFKGRISEAVELTPESDPFVDFKVFPDLKLLINEPPMTCIERLATADILVTSKSSFSYLAGILNVAGIVLYHPFWHSPLDHWIVAKPDGVDFDIGRLLRQVHRLRSGNSVHHQ
jgi:hypothetical protein